VSGSASDGKEHALSDKQTPPNPFDPSGAWRQGRDVYLDAWAKAMVETVNSDQYAKATGAMLDSYLTASSPFRDVLEKTMQGVLQQLSMPSKSDFVSLAERVTHIELRLDDMDAKLDQLVKQKSPASRPAPKAKKKRR
jgi:hypothetical protein